jgi:hypothetical protein
MLEVLTLSLLVIRHGIRQCSCSSWTNLCKFGNPEKWGRPHERIFPQIESHLFLTGFRHQEGDLLQFFLLGCSLLSCLTRSMGMRVSCRTRREQGTSAVVDSDSRGGSTSGMGFLLGGCTSRCPTKRVSLSTHCFSHWRVAARSRSSGLGCGASDLFSSDSVATVPELLSLTYPGHFL